MTDSDPDLPEDTDTGPTAAELEAAGQNALFGDLMPSAPAQASTTPAPEPVLPASAPASAPAPAAQPYRVLARKYRPQTFSELIGQEAMVQTLANAIKRDRLAHAFLMTGIRGVGKTSTARLIAKALNCIGPDGQDGPTIDPCGVCEPCRAIAEGRGPARFLVALGYAGWAPGQLDAEMQQHGWYAAAGRPDIVFDTPVTARWKAAWQAEGVDPALLSSTTGHA